MTGTIRSVSEKSRSIVHAELERIATHIAPAHGATAEFTLEPGYPVTMNDFDAASWVLDVAGRLVGDLAMEMPSPVMGAEDWSYVLQQVPGAMAFLGTCPPGRVRWPTQHRTTRTAWSWTSRPWPSARRCTPRSRSTSARVGAG